jgi:hypothetical protein
MAITRNRKRIIDPAGIVREVEVEIDPEADAVTSRFLTAGDIQRRLGFNLDSRNASTIGAGKHTGNMAKANAAKEFVGTCTNKEWRRRRRAKDAARLRRQDSQAAA